MMAYGGTTPSMRARCHLGGERERVGRRRRVEGGPQFSSPLFSSHAVRQRGGATPAGGLYRNELDWGRVDAAHERGSNRYFAAADRRARTEERRRRDPRPRPRPSSQASPVAGLRFSRTETGGDDNTPGFLDERLKRRR